MIPNPTGTTAVATNPEYAKLFAELGRQPRSRYCARRADSVPAQADHRQGRDASHRSRYRRSSRLDTRHYSGKTTMVALSMTISQTSRAT
jgi:hypothetical protein